MNCEEPSEAYSVLVNALLRYLLCISPSRAESVYYWGHQGAGLHDKWTRVIYGEHTGWIFFDREKGTGKFSPSPPRDIDPQSIPSIQIPAQYTIGLQTMADTLVTQAGGAATYPHLAGLLERLLAMDDINFENVHVADFLNSARDPRFYPAGFAHYQKDIISGMCEARFPGYFAGLMLLLLKAISGVEAIVLSGVFLLNKSAWNMTELLKYSLEQILVNDGPKLIEHAANELYDEGKFHLAETRKAARDEVFYGHIFLSCPFFFGAKQAFNFLLSFSKGPNSSNYSLASNECDELLVYASSSLLNHFENLNFGWPRWQEHVQKVSTISKTQGSSAADLKVIEYMDVAFFYPQYYRDALRNGLKPPPETAGTAGGAVIGKLCG